MRSLHCGSLNGIGSASGTRPTSSAITGIPDMAQKIVVDTSVLIKWIKTKDEELVNEARRLLTDVERRSLEVHVPALLLYEIGNILLLKTDLDAAGLNDAIS